jgi:DNA-binding NarL/FixJ family response regulator
MILRATRGTAALRALIVVDVPFYRQGLAELFRTSGEVQVVGAVSTADEATRVARTYLPEVVLIDIACVDASEALTTLRRHAPGLRIVALGLRETPENFLQWAENGITAYVTRNASFEDLMRVMRGAVRDELYCPPRIAATMLRRLTALAELGHREQPSIDGLSEREHEVLRMIAQGLSNKGIASRLGITAATAKNHVHNVLDKLHVHRRGEAAALFQRERMAVTAP